MTRKPGTYIFLVLIGILTVEFVSSFPTLFNPMGLRASEGDRMYIPCLNTPDKQIYYWKIRDSSYSVIELPLLWGLRIQTTPNGLIIPYTYPDMGGNYSCFTYDGNRLQLISTINFEVQAQGSSLICTPDDYETETCNDEVEEEMFRTRLNFVITESDIIFIPCVPVLGTENVTLWRIDNSLYPVLELPPHHIPIYGGIIVYNISSLNLMGSKYECFSQMRENYSIQLQYTVEVNFTDSRPDSEMACEAADDYSRYNLLHQLKVVSQGVSFINNKTYNFEFRIANITELTRCIPGNITTSMIISSGVNELWNSTTIKYKPTFSIPMAEFDDDAAYAKVTTTNYEDTKCANLPYDFRVDWINASAATDICVPEGHQGCIDLPDNLMGLNAFWPQQPRSDEDCVCGLFTQSPPSLDSCYCFSRNFTVYKMGIQGNQLCFFNLTRDTNETNLLLGRDAFNPVRRTFLSQTRFTVQGPNPSPPNFTQINDSTVCIKSRNGVEWSPVQRTNVVIYDTTSDAIQNNTIYSNNFCMDFPRDFPQTCAPFTLFATAYTKCSQSTASEFKHPANQSSGSNDCDCLATKVNMTMTIQESTLDSIAVTLNTSCLHLNNYDIDRISNLYLKATPLNCGDNCTSVNTSFEVKCCELKSMMVTLQGLMEQTTYNLTVVWVSPSRNSVCHLLEGMMSSTKMKFPVWAIVVMSVGGAIAILAIIAAILCARKKILNSKSSFSPNQESNDEGGHDYVAHTE